MALNGPFERLSAETIPEHFSLDRPSDRLPTQLVCKAASIRRDSKVQTTCNGSVVNNINITISLPCSCTPRHVVTEQGSENIPNSHFVPMPSISSTGSEADWRAETERYFEYLIKKFP